MTVGDFNNDEHFDIATVNPTDNNLTVIHGNGAGGFSAPVVLTAGNTPRGIIAADFTNDGKPELVIANRFQRAVPSPRDEVSVLPNNCPGVGAYVVTNSSDSGPGSLRQAILNANATAGGLVPQIVFYIPGAGVHTISPQSPLPAIVRPVSIDGSTQPGYNGAPLIQLVGSGAGAGANGLALMAGFSTVRGLAIGGFSGTGILLQTGGNNQIAGNYLGTNAAGMAALGNTLGVHLLAGASNNTIGGTVPGDGNLISGNATGIEIHGGASSNRVQGNTIGLNATGTAALGNSSSGIVIHNSGGPATNNTIGGTVAVARNVISGNVDGVVILGSGTMGNQVQGNYIGTNTAGTAAVGGGTWGVPDYHECE